MVPARPGQAGEFFLGVSMLRRVESGEWRVESGEWKVEGGENMRNPLGRAGPAAGPAWPGLPVAAEGK